MAKSPATSAPSLLPLPKAALDHHGQILSPLLEEWLSQKKVPPVLLITGIPGVGKRSVAYHLAQTLQCEYAGFSAASGQNEPSFFGSPAAASPNTAAPPFPCSECASCHRALRGSAESAGSWIDFTEIVPEDEGSETLKIDQFRKLKSTAGFGAHEGAYRITLIPNADRMTQQAANSMLKLLEEPPAGWIFFLTASDPTLILPTVLSRCQKLRLKPFPPESILELLTQAGVSSDRKNTCAELCHGSWGRAFSLASDAIWENRKMLFDFLASPKRNLGSLTDWASLEPSRFDLLVDQLESMTGDLIRWSLGTPLVSPETYRWLNQDGAKTLVSLAKSALALDPSLVSSRAFWMARSERMARSRQETLAPLNRKLLIQDLLLPWLNR